MRPALLRYPGAVALLALGVAQSPSAAAPRLTDGCATYAQEAASRSGLSVDTVMRVMMAESAGDPGIVSPKGAMGCMQIMPSTWRELTTRYRLGSNPFDARMNMIGGAMFLAELTVRYGSAGAIAAYNTGPGRYERYLSGAQALPPETIAYVQRIGAPAVRSTVAVRNGRWQEAALFLARTATSAATPATSPDQQSNARSIGADRLFPFGRSTVAQMAPSAQP